jgi:outer membrane protein TolC
MRKRELAVSLLFLTLAVATPAAQETLTLDDAIARSLAHSARLAEIDARRAGAEAAEAGRGAAKLPVVSAQAGYTRTNHVDEFLIVAPGQPSRVLYPDVPDNYRARIDLQWPIYTAGRADALERAASAEVRAVGEELEAARADLRFEVTRAFWALVTARETETVLQRSLERFDLHVRDLQARLDQGFISPHELLSAQAHRSRQRLLAIEAAATRRKAEADLRRLIGGPEAPIVPAADAANAPLDVPQLESAPLFRPERKALEYRLEAAQNRQAAAAAGGKPQLVVASGYDFARPNPRIFPRAERWEPSWDASINVSWTLWDGGRRSAERAEASAASRAVEARISEFDRQATFELQSRTFDLESARAGVDTAGEGLRAALEARRVVDERYQAGVATSTDVVDAEIVVLQAELDRTRATAAVHVAEAGVARAAGRRP